PFGDGLLAVSVDLSIEGTHFRRQWLSLEEIGWRAAAGALSDLAAAGAEAIGILASVGVPRGAPAEDAESLMEGVGAAAASVGGVVLGGDLAAAPSWLVDVTVLGRVTRAVTRGGTRPGDGVWVSGALGSARAALDAFLRDATPAADVRPAFARPQPRLAVGQALARLGVTAMIDLSDGLGGDAAHLAAASQCEIAIDLEAVPIGPGVAEEAGRCSVPPAVYAARGGEDYELLFTLPGSLAAEEVAAVATVTGVPLTRIGWVRGGRGVRLRLGGRDQEVRGFDHFA
ncbi:MAG: thiamine-phosphate kinase, partial [Gemmatimonadota bacterium]|nr:thiamine-phosphate kinase [Gemmatimonadota bacterium]